MNDPTSKYSPFKTISGIAAAIGAAAAAYSFFARPWYLHWGTSKAEVTLPLPGDNLIPEPRLNTTHAITIQASSEQIWPWLIQIGQGRGGFYSYEWIENLMGLSIKNTDRIMSVHQQLEVGDQIPLTPGGIGVPVAILEPNQTLVLFGDTRQDPDTIPTLNPGDYWVVSWGWYLFPISPEKTRLIERWRANWNSNLTNNLFMQVFIEPGAFLMERKMLLGIKHRAEKTPLS